VYNRKEKKERGQASHMGCQERVKAPLSISVMRRVIRSNKCEKGEEGRRPQKGKVISITQCMSLMR
jgi:hypothetical protein